MNAQELTERYYKDHHRLDELEKKVEFLEQEYQKLRMLVDDLKIDVQMIERRGRG